MHANMLYVPSPPWLYKSFLGISSIESAVVSGDHDDVMIVRCLDGYKMKTVEGVIKEFGTVLEFPEYFGENSAALYDCLQDLTWLPAVGYLLVVKNADGVLADEPSSEVTWLFELLQRVCEAWAQPIALGEAWDRPAVPFHLVFQIDQKSVIPLHSHIADLPELCCQ